MDKILLQELKHDKNLFKFLNQQRSLKKTYQHDDKLSYSLHDCDQIINECFGIEIKTTLFNCFKKFLKTEGTDFNTLLIEAKKQNKIIHHESVCDIVNRSMCWANTTQGHGFWRDIHVKWFELIVNNVIKPIIGETVALNLIERMSRHYVYL